MRKLNILVIGLFLAAGINAQEKEAIAKALESSPSMEIKNDLLKFKKETQQGFTSYLNSSQDEAEKKWKEFLENKYQISVKGTKGGLIAENQVLADIASSPMTVTALFSEDEKGCKMDVFYVMNGYFINSKEHPKETLAITASLKEYQKKLYVVVYQETLEDQRKIKEKNQKELDKLVKDGEKITKDLASEEGDITKAEEDIISSEQKIVELQAKMDELRGEIAQSKSTIEELKKAQAKKEKEIAAQTLVVKEKASQIDRIKAAADQVGIN